ncbi:MAG: MFS transporter [Hyphomonadaceae bacterium]
MTAAAAPQPVERVGFAAWTMVGVLVLLSIFSWLDRLILTMLVTPIREELGISVFQMSIVLGPAFAIFYAIFGVPIGWAVDRYPRRLIICVGVALWALATIASGHAETYEMLLLCRIFVGIGEATLAPAAVSLIADAFPRERVTTALSLFQSAAKVGAATAMALGGLAIAFAAALIAANGDMFGFDQPWRLVMALVGAPGLVLAFAVFAFREPPRKRHVAEKALSTSELFAFLKRRWVLWLGLFVAANCISILGFALSQFMPTYLESRFGWTPVQFGPGLSLTNLASAGALVFIGGFVDRLYRGGMRDAHLRFYSWLIVVLSPAFAFIFVVNDPRIVLVLYALIQFVTVSAFVFVSAIIVLAAPNVVRGQLAGFYIAAFTVLGQGVGPPLVGAITDFVFADEAMLGASLALVTVVGIIIAFVALQFARQTVTAGIRDMEAEHAALQA